MEATCKRCGEFIGIGEIHERDNEHHGQCKVYGREMS